MKSNFKYGSYRIKIKNIREETQNGFVKSKCPNNKFRASNGKVKKKKMKILHHHFYVPIQNFHMNSW